MKKLLTGFALFSMLAAIVLVSGSSASASEGWSGCNAKRSTRLQHLGGYFMNNHDNDQKDWKDNNDSDWNNESNDWEDESDNRGGWDWQDSSDTNITNKEVHVEVNSSAEVNSNTQSYAITGGNSIDDTDDNNQINVGAAYAAATSTNNVNQTWVWATAN